MKNLLWKVHAVFSKVSRSDTLILWNLQERFDNHFPYGESRRRFFYVLSGYPLRRVNSLQSPGTIGTCCAIKKGVVLCSQQLSARILQVSPISQDCNLQRKVLCSQWLPAQTLYLSGISQDYDPQRKFNTMFSVASRSDMLTFRNLHGILTFRCSQEPPTILRYLSAISRDSLNLCRRGSSMFSAVSRLNTLNFWNLQSGLISICH